MENNRMGHLNKHNLVAGSRPFCPLWGKAIIVILAFLFLTKCNRNSNGSEEAYSDNVQFESVPALKIKEDVIYSQFIEKYNDNCYIANLPPRGFDYEQPLGKCLLNNECLLLEDDSPMMSHESGCLKLTHPNSVFSSYTSWSFMFAPRDFSDPRKNGRKYKFFALEKGNIKRAKIRIRGAKDEFRIRIPKQVKFELTKITWRNPSTSTCYSPRLYKAGKPYFPNMDEILEELNRNGISERLKAISMWELLSEGRYTYFQPSDDISENSDPIKLTNVYGFGICNNTAYALMNMATYVGLPARKVGLGGRHVVTEIYYDGGWHMFDADQKVYYLNSDV